VARTRRFSAELELGAYGEDEYHARLTELYEACPEAHGYTEEEVEDFLAAAQYLDMCQTKDVVLSLRRARITYPLDLAFDHDRLCRHILRRWADPALRQQFLRDAIEVNYGVFGKLKKAPDSALMQLIIKQITPAVARSVFRRVGLHEALEQLREVLTPEQVTLNEELMMIGRLKMHQCLAEPEPPRSQSRWEQQKLMKRIKLRDVQLHAMSRSLHRLRRQRTALLARLRKAGRTNQPELDALAGKLEEVRQQRAAAEERHAAALADQRQRFEEAAAALRQQIAQARIESDAVVAMRSAWLPKQGGRLP